MKVNQPSRMAKSIGFDSLEEILDQPNVSLEHPRHVKAYIYDLIAPQAPRKAFLLAMALEKEIPQNMQKYKLKNPLLMIEALDMLSEEDAQWAVEAWAEALHISLETQDQKFIAEAQFPPFPQKSSDRKNLVPILLGIIVLLMTTMVVYAIGVTNGLKQNKTATEELPTSGNNNEPLETSSYVEGKDVDIPKTTPVPTSLTPTPISTSKPNASPEISYYELPSGCHLFKGDVYHSSGIYPMRITICRNNSQITGQNSIYWGGELGTMTADLNGEIQENTIILREPSKRGNGEFVGRYTNAGFNGTYHYYDDYKPPYDWKTAYYSNTEIPQPQMASNTAAMQRVMDFYKTLHEGNLERARMMWKYKVRHSKEKFHEGYADTKYVKVTRIKEVYNTGSNAEIKFSIEFSDHSPPVESQLKQADIVFIMEKSGDQWWISKSYKEPY